MALLAMRLAAVVSANKYASLVTVVVILSVLQTWNGISANRRLQTAVATVTAQMAGDSTVAIGSRVVDIVGYDMAGRRAALSTVNQSGRRTLVFSVSASCTYCDQSRERLINLANVALSRGWRVAWVLRDPVVVNVRTGFAVDVPGEVVAEPTHNTWLALGLTAVPQSIAVGSDGAVMRVWPGVMTADVERNWLEMFN
jgi:hypothetical protein